jgi:hypothetical protein
MTAVRFERRGGMYAVTFVYDADLVELLKVSVPAYARSWNRTRREWLIEDAYSVQLADTMRRFGCTVVGLEPSHNRCCDDPADWARALFKRVGPSRAEPVFRSLTRVLHPDNATTGDTHIQRELNAARAELTTERKSA